MTELLVTAARRRNGESANGTPICVQSLTAQGRSGRLPRHEEDLSTQEGQEKPHARLPAALEEPGWKKRAEAPARQGPQAAHAQRSEEVSGRSGVRLGKAARLTLRSEFLAVQERGKKLHAGAYVVLVLPNELGRPRLGVTVSTRVGNSVVRNRVKRWVREAFRATAHRLPALDVVLVARSGAPDAGLEGARRALAAVPAAEAAP
jgi:ribonuclease P protein component